MSRTPTDPKSSEPSRFKRWFKRLAVGAAGLLAIAFVYLAVEHVRGRISLGRRLAELSERGERLSVATLEPKRPAPDQNSAIVLRELTNTFAGFTTNWDNLPPSLRFAAPGRAVITWRLTEWSRDGKVTNNWDRIGGQLQQAQGTVDTIHSAAMKPNYDSGFDYRKGFVDFQIGPLAMVKRAAQVLNVATDYELSRGRLDAAQEHLLALVKLAASQKSEPMVICQLVRQACAVLAFNATWETLQAPGGTDAQFAALQAAWEKADFSRDMAASFEMERAMQLDFFEQIRRSKAKLDFVIGRREGWGEPFNTFVTHGCLLKWVNLPLWQIAWARQDELRGLERWQEIIDHDRIARSNSWAGLRGRTNPDQSSETLPFMGVPIADDRDGWFDRFRFLFSAGPFSISDLTIHKTLGAQTQQCLAVTAIALRRFHLRTGKLPSDLNALVPDYLHELPRDFMDGGILRYRLTARGGFILYSVGEDGHDDGGDPSLRTDKKRYRQIWDGRDAIWPSPATSAETAEAMNSTKE